MHALPDVVRGAELDRLAPQALASSTARSRRWHDLRLRTASALVLGPAGLAAIWFDGWAFTAMVALFAFGLSVEYARMSGAAWRDWRATLVALAVAASTVATANVSADAASIGLGAVCVLMLLAGRTALAACLPYIGTAAVAVPWLRQDAAAGRADVLFLFLVIWANDIGAYVFGRYCGGPALAPLVSPGKTWAGAVGGLACGCIAGVWIAAGLDAAPGPGAALGAMLIGVAAQLGDLLESWAKRHFGVKDSSGLIPGHGGLLDRLDGALIAAPLAAALAWWAGPGVTFWSRL